MVLITILGHLRGLYVAYKYSYHWLMSTMNLQVESDEKIPDPARLRCRWAGGEGALNQAHAHNACPAWSCARSSVKP